MNISELEKKLKEDNMLKVHVDGVIKRYVSGDYVYKNGKWENKIDVFGIYKSESNEYGFFVTDSERGLAVYGRDYDTEEEACAALIERMYLEEEIYQEKNNYF